MKTITYYLVFILAGVLPVFCETQIDTSSQTRTVAAGSTAEFECKVRNLEASQSVIWQFVDHNQTISTGNEIRAKHLNPKYTIFRPQDSEGYWNLKIYRADLTDQGSYKCYVSGMESTVKVIHHLEITDAPNNQPAPHLNVTDCCVASGVEKCALPMCVTSTPVDELLTIAKNGNCMTNNLVKVLQCGQDGRNHMGCCIRRGLSDLCQNLCKGWGEDDGTDYTSCIGIPILGLVECFKEGNVLMPSPPTGVSAVNMGTSLLVTWQPPVENSDVVVNYKIQYKKKGDLVFNSTKPLSPISQMEELSNLELNIVYEIQVVALAQSGASQPSLPILMATGEVIPLSNYTETVKQCCQEKNISLGCQDYCDTSIYYAGGHPDMLKCLSELNVIYQCIAGHGDHTPCCKRVQVPDQCSGMCRGESSVDWGWSIVECLSYMNQISGCVIEGSIALPDPPKNTRILAESVTSTSAIVAWEAPENTMPGDYYTVSWKIDKLTILNNWTSVDVIGGTTYELTGLEPASIYDVIVITVNAAGSSLPELTLLLITEGSSSPPDTTFNETECCMEKGVTGNCLQLCVHQFRVTDQVLMTALTCPDALEHMLVCGTDGRDHRECCRREGIPDNCLGLCNLQLGVTPNLDFLMCVAYKDTLSRCFDEGKAVLPRSPEDVEVKKIEMFSIVIDWKPPGGPNITNYTVEYSMDKRFWIKGVSTNQTFYAAEKLKPDTVYYFRVTSNNTKGQSTPSNVIVAYTLAVPENKTDAEWMQLWKNREDCCSSSNISGKCQSSCVSGVSEDINMQTCSTDIDKIIACGADGRDHSDCCKRKIPGFSLECLHYCRGQSGPRDLTAALCLTFLGPILTCFTEGQGLLPTPPQNVKATAVSSMEITMRWSQPASNCDSSCSYAVYIWLDSNHMTVDKNNIKGNDYTFSNLKPETTYRVAVVSYNPNGMSLPSPYVIITTPSDSPHTVSVSQAPSGVVDSQTSVQLECVGLGADLKRVKWIRNKQDVFLDNLYLIQAVTSKDQGLYTCEVTFVDGKVKAGKLYLNVKFKPIAKKMSEKTVLPGVGQDAKMSCEFEGFPDIITWSKDGNNLQGGSKYDMRPFDTDLVTGKTTSTLIVKNVVSADFGSYTCNGSNKFGDMHSTGNLSNTFPVTSIPTYTPPVKTNVSECCRSKGVPPECAKEICTYAIDINKVLSNSELTHCANYLLDFFTCGVDGKDHTKCCTKKGVQEYCLPFCAGVIPDHDNQLELLVCLPHMDVAINCSIEGAKYIPSPPKNVRAQVMSDTVKVSWDPPSQNADKVDVYHVYYMSKSLPVTYDAASKLSTSKHLQSDLIKKGETYSVWVIAINDFGSSNKSMPATVTVTRLVPPVPSNLLGNALPNNIIEVSWEAPKTKLKIIKYALHYHTVGGSERIANPIDTSTRLIDLKPNTKYIMSVAAVSTDGEGMKTKPISVTTIESTQVNPVPTPQKAKGDNKTVGVVVGVVLGLIFLVAIAIVAVFLFRRVVRPKGPQNQTVAFENPHYASGQRVTGLPGENDTNPFQYGKLNEDTDHEHSYMTLENTHTSNNETPATLNLDQA